MPNEINSCTTASQSPASGCTDLFKKPGVYSTARALLVGALRRLRAASILGQSHNGTLNETTATRIDYAASGPRGPANAVQQPGPHCLARPSRPPPEPKYSVYQGSLKLLG